MTDGLTPDERSELDALAATPSPNRWTAGADISLARNKHRTNTFDELRAGLVGDWNWFEADVRWRDGRVVCAHDRDDEGLTFDEWLAIGIVSGRGLKVDCKQERCILPAARAALDAGLDPRMLLMNVQVATDVNPTSVQTLRELRELLPGALINLSPGHEPYTRHVLDELEEAARVTGEPVMFPLHDPYVNRRVVRRLLEMGRVAVWNDPRALHAASIPRRTRQLRSWGVDGMVDLRGRRRSYEEILWAWRIWRRIRHAWIMARRRRARRAERRPHR